MSTKRSRFASTVRLLSHAVESRTDEHPAPEKLLAWRAGALPEAAATELEEHLGWCRVCAELARDIAVLEEPPPEPVPKRELDAAWARFQARSAPAVSSPAATAVEPPRRPERGARRARLRSPVPRWAAVAASTVVALGVGWLMGRQLAPHEGDTPRPRVNAPRYSLYPEGSDRASGSSPTAILLEKARGGATVVLNPSEVFAPGLYRLRWVDSTGRRIWESEPTLPSRSGDFSLDLPAGFAPRGRSRIELRKEGASEAPLAIYLIEIQR